MPPETPSRSTGQSAGDPALLLNLDDEAKRSVRILIVDDERTLRESCRSLLGTEGYSVEVCGKGGEALDVLRRRPFDVVLMDLYMSGVSGMELLKAALEQRPETVVIMMTGNPSVTSSIEALRAGAWDYLTKPFSATQLQILMGRAAHSVLVNRETNALQADAAGQGQHEGVKVLGMSPAFKRVIELARRVARTDASVFIAGESGTGKELIAEFIHHHSRRSARPMVAVNCAALPEPLLESEMFGHRKGAFTGAVRDKPGLLETAHGGTMFLDEVTEMSKPIQAKLLRVIQDGMVRRVGSESVDAIVNVRFIAATNRNPDDAVRDGTLREDLYYRLRVVPITIPPLRERLEGIPALANHFLRQYWARHRDPGSPIPRLGESALWALRRHPWPGNVRELQNVIEHTVVLAEAGTEILASQLPIQPDGHPAGLPAPAATPAAAYDEAPYHVARDRVIGEFELQYLTALVNRTNGNMSRAARMAGVDRTTLYRLMEKHGLQRETIMVEGERNGEASTEG